MLEQKTHPDFLSIENSCRGLIKVRYARNKEILNLLKSAGAIFRNRRIDLIKDDRKTTVGSLLVDVEGVREKLYIKRYNNRDVPDLIKNIFRPSRAAKYWEKAQDLAKRGFSVPKPVGFTDFRKRGILLQSYFISRAIDSSQDIVSFFQTEFSLCPLAEKFTFIEQLGNFVRRLHKANIAHGDLRGSNVFIQRNPNRGFAFHLIDLDSAFVKRSLMLKHRQFRDLSQLNRSFEEIASRANRLRFLKAYLSEDFNKKKTFYASGLEKRAARRRGRRIIRLRKILKKGGLLYKKDGYSGYVKTKFAREREVLRLLKEPDKILKEEKVELVKDGRTSTVACLDVKAGNQTKRIYIKRYNNRGSIDLLKNIFRASRAKKSWKGARILTLHGFLVPETIAFLDSRRFRLLKKSFVFSEAIPAAVNVKLFFKKKFASAPLKQKHSFIRQFAYLIKRLHTKGIYHADLAGKNILVKRANAKGFVFYLIDLDRVLKREKIKRRRKFKNLSQLNRTFENIASKPDRLRFLKAYLEKDFERQKRLYVKEIEKWTKKWRGQ